MKKLTIVAYSDIHWSNYTNGLLPTDTQAVEKQVLQIAKEYRADIILFGGDRFRERNPVDEVKSMADAEVKRKSRAGIPTVYVVGNHDRWTRSAVSGHSLKFVKYWEDELPLAVVADERRAYPIQLSDGRLVAIHAVPADHELAVAPLQPYPGADFDVCVFHNLLLGSFLQNGAQAGEGMSMEAFDLPWLDLVLGGDNHRYQELPFKNTRGWYVGAAMQLNWGDLGEKRGVSVFEITKDGSGRSVTHRHFQAVSPQFLKFQFDWTNERDFDDYMSVVGRGLRDQIVRIEISGKAEVLDKVDKEALEEKYRASTMARRFNIIKDMETPAATVGVDAKSMSTLQNPVDDWNQYIAAGVQAANGLDIEKLRAMGLQLLDEVA